MCAAGHHAALEMDRRQAADRSHLVVRQRVPRASVHIGLRAGGSAPGRQGPGQQLPVEKWRSSRGRASGMLVPAFLLDEGGDHTGVLTAPSTLSSARVPDAFLRVFHKE